MKSLYLEGIEFQEFELSLKKIIGKSLEEALLTYYKKENTHSDYKTRFPKNQRATNLELFTRKEVSKLLKVSLVTLHEWEKSKKLIPVRVGTRVRYKVSTIEMFINSSLTSKDIKDEKDKL